MIDDASDAVSDVIGCGCLIIVISAAICFLIAAVGVSWWMLSHTWHYFF